MSDREQCGLRGSVKACVEESTYAGAPAADGTQIPERKSWHPTEYDADGRTMITRTTNSNGSEWLTRYAYVSGHVLKIASGKEGELSRETIYSYDDQGRLQNIVDSGKPHNPVIFHYDEHGRKTKVQVSLPEDYRRDVAVGGSPFQVADTAPNLPGGGSATTIYDEHDRPTEVLVRDGKGELVSRAVRVYDALGRVSEEKQILDNPETIIPAEIRAKMLESGASLEEIREQLTKLMGGHEGPSSIAYSYDEEGRVKKTWRRIFNEEHEIELNYNEHGDKALEVTRGRQIGSEESERRPGLPSYSEVLYSYEYDRHGNWTEAVVSYRSSPGGAFEYLNARRRTLTYYGSL